jgi:hypothetical protein
MTQKEAKRKEQQEKAQKGIVRPPMELDGEPVAPTAN